VTVPGNYDAVTMNVEPGPLNMAADGIQDSAEAVVTALNTINKALNELHLGWDGASAAEAKDFANKWHNAMIGMFGTSKDPKKGVMNQVIIALKAAVGNYSNAEEGIEKMFMNFDAMLISGSQTQTPDTTPLPAGPSGTFDMSSTAITEINWTGIPGS
jgi:Proteins of 100 residues with WXG